MRKKLLFCFVCFLLFAWLSIVPLFADDITLLSTKFIQIFYMLRRLAVWGASVSLAINGMILLTGSDEAAKSAKTGIKYTIIALIAFQFIVTVWNFGTSMMNMGWDPSHLMP